MSIIRLITIRISADKAAEAIRNWKAECGPLMIKQKGCTSEQLLHNTADAGEFISYSEWESLADIDAYLASADHQAIKRHNLKLGPAEVRVKTYARAS